VHRLSVEHLVVGVVDSQFGATLARGLDHRRSEIGRHEPTVSEPWRRHEARVAGAGGDFKNALSGLRIEVLHQPLVDRARRREPAFALLVPASRLTVPHVSNTIGRDVVCHAVRPLSG
jgi:hypothetical protein